MKILFFAQSRLATGCAETELKLDHAITAHDLWQQLTAAFPDLASVQENARLARNETYLVEGETLQPEDEIAVLPPVSGG